MTQEEMDNDHVKRGIFAQEDWDHMLAADCVVSFTEPKDTSSRRGGRHVEFGGALALGKRLIVIGHRENIFHCLPQVEFFGCWEDALRALCSAPAAALGAE